MLSGTSPLEFPTFSRWTAPGYLEAALGHRTLPVEVGSTYLDTGWGQQLMTFNEFMAAARAVQPSTQHAASSHTPPATASPASLDPSVMEAEESQHPAGTSLPTTWKPAAPAAGTAAAPDCHRVQRDQPASGGRPGVPATGSPRPPEPQVMRKRRRIFAGALIRPGAASVDEPGPQAGGAVAPWRGRDGGGGGEGASEASGSSRARAAESPAGAGACPAEEDRQGCLGVDAGAASLVAEAAAACGSREEGELRACLWRDTWAVLVC